ncbi:acriflavin resistance protein [Parablautia intestinalis]|uniref:Acriflavin resistance protein n=1 Tax=Parablautia intestinalis TaxID=2320100 RepID=A0A3A9B233_9FIRM|nr:efflux RND transporter permease subunit [Parablautia intestinalis]RKI93516.1 acriflavin resistance protein [Parablautia intestinalis]
MLSKFSVKKPYTVLVAVVLAVVLGVVSFTRMTTDLLPGISLPYVIVMTTYAGASPETVETVVTKPVEASMATVSNIESISSVSSENYSTVILEFAQSTDMNAASLEIRENLDQIKSYWNDSVGNPIIMKLNPDMLPVMIAAVGGTDMDAGQVTSMTQDTIIPELESIEGVASVSATGLLEESVSVVIRQEKIDKINEQVFGAIDEEIDEVKEELNENKQDIYEGQSELEDARVEMEDSKQKLTESQQELEDSRKEIEDGKQKLADGKAEIAENKVKLEEGKTELASKKDEAARELAEAETKLLTAKADAEAAKIHMTLELEQAKMMLEEAKKGLEENGVVPPDGIESPDVIEAGIAEGNKLNNDLGAYGDGDIYKDVVNDDLRVEVETYLAPDFPSDREDTLTVGEVKGLIDNKISDYERMQGILDNFEQQAAAQEFIKQTIATYEQTIAEMAGKISELEDNISKIDDGLNQLYKGNLKAASEFANAQTTISLGELQITTAEAQIEATEKQLESGQEQLEAGQEQIDSGWEQIADGEEQLKDTAEQLADALQQILDGEEELEENRVNAYDKANMKGILTVETVEALLQAQNFSMPAGYVTEDGISYLIRVGDKPEEINELKRMPLMNLEMDGVDIITLGDVADVFMTDNSADIYANVNGAPGIMVTIQKQTGYSTGDVSDRILEKFRELMDENENLMLITLMDQGIYIDLVMDSILNNILFGAGLAILILILFLKDLRPTAVIACSIPISLITTIVCMYFSGVTLNVISLSGLALGIGMLVDNSIVVIENIYRLRREGCSAKEAAIEGAGEVAGAIMASTLTTVCVFLPIVFTEGITRQLFVDMGLTIGYSLLASLVIALTVVPAMASKALVKTREDSDGKFFTKVVDLYGKLLGLSLKAKPVVILLVVVLLVVSAMASYAKGTAFMPDMDSTQFTISLTMPEDALLSETAQVTDEIVEKLIAHEDVSDVGAMASASSLSMLTGGGDVSPNETVIYVTLNRDKEKTNEVIADEIMEQTAEICEKSNAEMVIDTSSMDMSAMGGSGVTVQIRGRDIDKLQELAVDIASIVGGVEGTANVTDGLEDSMEEMRVIIDRNKAIEHGMTVAEVFSQVAGKLAESASATTLETEENEYGVYVKDAKDLELTRALIKDLEIERTTKDDTKEKFPLSEVASFESTISPKAVNRIDQNRYISVSAEIADGYNVGLVSADVEKALKDYKLPAGYYLEMTGENETITDAMEQLYLMLLLALIFMYLIMVAQFQSLLSPFIIMFTIPLAFTGGFFGLVISNSELSVIALIGFVMLSGIIVNNGIVLVDYINQLRAEGMEKKEAILRAGRTRLRPVLMTALTTILALCTMVTGNDMGSEMGRPMAVVTIGGLVYGTLLTLVVIPCIYDIFSREKKR